MTKFRRFGAIISMAVLKRTVAAAISEESR
jgi:hypothetical protein